MEKKLLVQTQQKARKSALRLGDLGFANELHCGDDTARRTVHGRNLKFSALTSTHFTE